MQRREFISLAAVLGVAAATPKVVRAQGMRKVSHATTAAFTKIISTVGSVNGIYKEAGLDTDIVTLQRGSEALQALLAGQVDFAEAASASFVAATSRGADLRVVAEHSHGYYGKLIASEGNKDLSTLEEFKGKKIGVQFGTGVHTTFMIILGKLGFTPSDFELTNLRVSDMPTAMQSGSFDAVLGWEPMMTRIVAAGFGHQVISSQDFEKMAGVYYPLVIVTRPDIMEKEPELVTNYLRAWRTAQKFVQTNPDETVDILMRELGDIAGALDKETVRQVLYGGTYYDTIVLPQTAVDEMNDIANYLKEQGVIKDAPDMATLVDMTFAKKAQADVG